MSTFVYMTRCDGCGHCVDICPSDIMHIDETISDKILNGRIDANHKYSIDSTPTIIINEKKLEGSANFKNIKKKIDKII